MSSDSVLKISLRRLSSPRDSITTSISSLIIARAAQNKVSGLGILKSTLDKTKFATEMPKVDALRARLQYQNRTISVLLISAGNSSLEQIEKMDWKMTADIEKLTKMMMQLTHKPPEDTPLNYQSPLTKKFLAEAEKGAEVGSPLDSMNGCVLDTGGMCLLKDDFTP